MRENCWDAATTQAQKQHYKVAHSNIHLLKHMKGPVLQIQN